MQAPTRQQQQEQCLLRLKQAKRPCPPPASSGPALRLKQAKRSCPRPAPHARRPRFGGVRPPNEGPPGCATPRSAALANCCLRRTQQAPSANRLCRRTGRPRKLASGPICEPPAGASPDLPPRRARVCAADLAARERHRAAGRPSGRGRRAWASPARVQRRPARSAATAAAPPLAAPLASRSRPPPTRHPGEALRSPQQPRAPGPDAATQSS